MAVVGLHNLGKTYPGSIVAVRGVDLEIGDGEFMVLLGPSGCGKSTTLRMIAGLESITEGELTIDGATMNGVPAKNRDIAMVFQSYALYPHMSVYDNMAFGLRRRGFKRTEIDLRVREAAASLALSEYLERRPQALSGGQRQRVALGRAIVRHPKVFLFDEPLSNLDAALRVSTRNELIRLHRRLGATMIYVTHDQIEAMSMGTRIAIMNAGELVQAGPPLEVYNRPATTFVARFLGSPPMNLVEGSLSAESDVLRFRGGGLDIALPDHDPSRLASASSRAVTFGIRPEDLRELPPQGASSRAGITGEVAAIEALGAETLVTVQTAAGTAITARVPRTARSQLGSQATLWIDTAAVHLFDAATTRALDGRRAAVDKGVGMTAGV